MKQFEIPLDARSCNDDVDGLVNGHAFGAQGAIIPRSLKTDLIAAQLVKQQLGQKCLSLAEISVLAEPLQDLREDQVP